MALAASSLSVAIEGFADFLDGTFDNDVVITVDSPQKVGKPGDNNSKHTLNVFPYRIAPSGVHPDAGGNEPFFIRAYVLLTAFPASAGNASTDADLQVLGHALRALQSNPAIPVTLPTPIPNNAPATDFRNGPFLGYRLQAVLQSPTMEELNHIWTTQGSDLAYRLSLAYELALIPIEPLAHVGKAPSVRTGELVLSASPRPLPFIMFIDGERLFNERSIPPAREVALVLAGDPGPDDDRHANIVVDWTRVDGETTPQAPQTFKLESVDLTQPQVRITVTLDDAADGDTALISAFPADSAGEPLESGRPSNLLTLRIDA